MMYISFNTFLHQNLSIQAFKIDGMGEGKSLNMTEIVAWELQEFWTITLQIWPSGHEMIPSAQVLKSVQKIVMEQQELRILSYVL